MSKSQEFAWMPAHNLRRMIANKQVSPVEITELALRRIESLNPKLNAFLTTIADLAIDHATDSERAVIRGDKLGPLHGIPISIKDLEGVSGVRQTNGCLVHKDNISESDSLAAERIKAAGAIIIGKTNTSEFGHIGTNENRLGDACRNPWDPNCTSGASSGGAAASVASGITAIAQGSDGGGSIRIPSSFCGIYGLKPSQGRVPRRDTGIGSWHPINFSCVGPMTRDVRDAAILTGVLAGDSTDAEPGTIQSKSPDFETTLEQGVRGLRVGWSSNIGGVPVDPEVVKVAQSAAERFESLGSHVDVVDFRIDDPEIVFDTFQAMYRTRAYALHGHLLKDNKDELTEYFIDGMELGEKLKARDLFNAQSRLNRYRAYIANFFTRFDLLLTPTLAVPAFPINSHPETIGGSQVVHRLWGFTPFTYPFNMGGNPAASVPAGFSAKGMPIGLQIIGAFGNDELVLAASYAFEQVKPWANHRPHLN